MQGYGDKIGVSGQGFIDRIVHDFIDHMVQTGPVIGVANIHSRPLAHGFKPFQNLDGIGVVSGVLSCGFRGLFWLLWSI